MKSISTGDFCAILFVAGLVVFMLVCSVKNRDIND